MNLTFDELERRLYANGEIDALASLLILVHENELDREFGRGYDAGRQEAKDNEHVWEAS